MNDERIKQLMEQVGCPDSLSHYTRINQIVNEVTQEVRDKTIDKCADTVQAFCDDVTVYQEVLNLKWNNQLIKPSLDETPKFIFKIVPTPPTPPICRTIREGCGKFCPKCGSTMSGKWLFFFGKDKCHAIECGFEVT